MALPVTITGISTAVAPVGPFKAETVIGPLVISTALGNLIQPIGGSAGGTERVGQVFTVGANGGSLSSAQLYLQKIGSPTDNIVVNIYAVDAGGLFPTGASLATASTLASSIPNGAWITFTFGTPLALAANTKYILTAQRSGAMDGSNCVNWYGGTDIYPGGKYSVYTTANGWQSQAPYFNSECMMLQLFDVDVGNSTLITTTTVTALTPFGNAATPRVAQTFTTDGMSVTKLGFRLRRATGGTYSDQIAADIYATDAGGLPTGPSLAQALQPAKWISQSRNDEFSFWFDAPVALAAGKYAAVLSRTGATHETQYFNLLGAPTDVYAGGSLVSFNGTSWTASASADGTLKVTYLAKAAYYFFGRDGTTATTLQAYKAIDPSVTPLETCTSNASYHLPIADQVGRSKISQEWLQASGASLRSVVVALRKISAPTDNVICDIFQTDASGFPTGSSLGTSAPIAASTVTTTPTTGTDTAFTFSPSIVLSAGTKYAAVFSRSGAIDGSNYITLHGQNTDVYPDGKTAAFNSPTWGATLYEIRLVVNTNNWGSAATKTGFTTAILNLQAYQAGTTIHIVVQDGTASTALATKYVSFDAATDTFLATTETVSAAVAVTGQIAGAGAGCALVVRSNGEVVAFYSGVQTKTSGTFRARVYYRRRTAVNTWSTETQVDNNTAVDNNLPVAVLGAADRVHFLSYNQTITAHRTLSAANALSTAATASTPSIGDAVSYDRAGTTKIVATSNANGAQNTLRFDSSDSPTAIIAAQGIPAAQIPHRIGVDTETDDVTIIYRSSTDNDLWAIKSTDDGATFGAPVLFFAGTVGSTDASASRSSSGSLYQRGSTFVVGYVVNDNGTLKYNEYVVRYATQADAWNANSKGPAGANLTLSDNDKTAAFSGTGGIRSTTPRVNQAAGKYYAEFSIGYFPYIIGLISEAASVSSSASGAQLRVDGTIWYGSTQIGALGASVATNDVVGFAWDALAERIWFRKNNGSWNGSPAADPVTDSGGIDISTYTGGGNQYLWMMSSGVISPVTLRTELADFTLGIPYGFASWMGEIVTQADAWNAADKTANVTLSDGDKTATAPTVGTQYIRSTTKYAAGSAGKYYAEFVQTGTVQSSLGLTDATTALTATKSFSYGPYTAFISVNGGANLGNAAGAVLGDVISFAWDSGAKRGWFRVNNDNWFNGGNPETGVGGYDLSAITTNSHALFYSMAVPGAGATLRTEAAEFTQTTPTGFLSWMGETLIVPDLGALAPDAAAIAGAGVVQWAGTGNLTARPLNYRLNLVPWSQSVDNVNWVKNLCSVFADYTAAPDGSTTADSVTTDATTGSHYIYTNAGSIQVSGPQTLSVYAKPAVGGSWIRLVNNLNWANFNVATGTTGQSGGATLTASNITAVGNGWYRLSITETRSAGQSTLPEVDFLNGDTAIGSTHAAVMTFYLWGFQYETSSVATPYIPTFSTTQSTGDTLIGVGSSSSAGTATLTAVPITRKNFLRRSQNIVQAGTYWSTNNVTTLSDDAIAPNGTLTAERLTDNAVNGPHYLYEDVTTDESPAQHTFSLHAKAGTLRWLCLHNNSGSGGLYAYFDLVGGVVGSKHASATSRITAVGDGWYRCEVTTMYTSGGSAYIFAASADGVAFPNYVGGSGTHFIWGGQFERGDVATAYIPTGDVAVTVADTLVGTGIAQWAASGALSVGTPAVITATGTVVVPPATGTGVLTSNISAIAGAGISSSMTGAVALVATPSSLRTNYLSWSESIDNAFWAKANVSLDADAVTAPNGTLTAETITSNAINSTHGIYPAVLVPAFTAGAMSVSVYLKAGTAQWVQLTEAGAYCNFDLTNGVKGAQTAATAAITAVGDGWYRCSFGYTKSFAVGLQPQLYILPSNVAQAGAQHTLSGLSVHVWGFQEEQNAIPTAYIPTTSAAISTGIVIAGTGTAQFVSSGPGVLQAASASRTNLVPYSQQFDTAWVTQAATIQANALQAPDGTLTAEQFTDNATNSSHFLRIAAVSPTETYPYTFSFFAKAGTLSWVQPNIYSQWANFNLQNGTIGNKHSLATASIASVGDGWYRCSLTITDVVTNIFVYVGTLLSDLAVSGPSYVGSNQTIYLWGAQLERGSVATGYIPTTTTTAVGAPEVLAGRGTVRDNVVGSGALLSVAAQRTNIALRSQEFNLGAWYKNAATVLADSTQAPDGSQTADALTDTATFDAHFAQSNISGATPGTYTFSVYAKPGAQWIRLDVGGSAAWANFNLLTGVKGQSGSTTAVITLLPNSWWRCSITCDIGLSTTAQIMILSGDVSNPAYTGDGFKSVYLWGAQFERGSAPTDYILTDDSPASIPDVVTGRSTVVWLASGALSAGAATIACTGIVQRIATGTLVAQPATTVAPARSTSIGSGTLVITTTATLSGAGMAVDAISGPGALTSFATVSAVGVSQSVSTAGALTSIPATTAATGVAFTVITAQALAVAAPTIGASGITTVLTFVNLVPLAPVLGVPPLGKLLSAANLATGPPALAAITPRQVHALDATPTVVASPSYSAVVIGQAGVFAAMPLAINNLVIGTAAFNQRQAIAATALAVAPPSIGQADYGHVFTAISIAVVAPTFPVPVLRKVLIPAGFASSAPVLGTSAITTALTAVDLTPVPAIGTSSITQRHILTGNSIAIITPTYSPVVIGQAGVLQFMPLVAGQPVFSIPVFGQRAVMATSALVAGLPAIDASTIAQAHALASASLVASAPVLGTSSIKQTHVIAAVPFTTAPAIDVAVLRQANILTAAGFTVATPTVNVTAFGQGHLVTALNVSAGVPTAGSSVLRKVLQATALAVSTPVIAAPQLATVLPAALPVTAGTPVLSAPAMVVIAGFGMPVLWIGPPVIGAPLITQLHQLAQPVSIVVGAPTSSAPFFQAPEIFVALPMTSGAPVFERPAMRAYANLTARDFTVVAISLPHIPLGVCINLVPTELAIGASDFTAPDIGQRHDFTTTRIMPYPAIGVAQLGQDHSLTAANLVGGRPVIRAGFISQAGVMAAVPLWVASPVLDEASPRQRHDLAAPIGVAAGRPSLGAAAVGSSVAFPRAQSTYAGRFKPLAAVLGQAHRLIASTVTAGPPRALLPKLTASASLGQPTQAAAGSPALGAPLMAVSSRLVPVGIRFGYPALARPQLVQEHVLTARDLGVAGPQLQPVRLGEPGELLGPIGITTAAPVLGAPALWRRARLYAIANITGRRGNHATIVATRKHRNVV